MSFKKWLFEQEEKGKISKEDIKDAREAGLTAAKKIFGDEYDEKKAEKLVDDMIKKYKDKVDDVEDLIQTLVNAFRGE